MGMTSRHLEKIEEQRQSALRALPDHMASTQEIARVNQDVMADVQRRLSALEKRADLQLVQAEITDERLAFHFSRAQVFYGILASAVIGAIVSHILGLAL